MIKRLSWTISATVMLAASLSLAAPTGAPAGFSCPQYKFDTKEFSLSDLNPAAQTISGVALPATNQVLYRGAYEANGQFDFSLALRGLFKEQHWYVGSPLFWGITQVLKKSWGLNNDFLPSGGLPLKMREYFSSRGILDDVETLLHCAPDKGYSAQTANALAADLMNKAFRRTDTSALQENFFNILNPLYYRADFQAQGLGNNAVDFIISSAYDQVAAVYGKKVLVMKDTRKRAFDLGYWNKAHNDIFWHHWVDNGEVNVPGYITSDELLGYQQRKVDRPLTGWGEYYVNPIDYAIYRHSYKGQTIVLLLDGHDASCISKGDDGRYYYCPKNWDNISKDIVPYPEAGKKNYRSEAAIMGAFVLCDEGDTCTLPAAFWTEYGKTVQRDIPAAAAALIKAIKIDGKAVQYVSAEQVAAPDNGFEGIKVVSATYLKSADRSKKTNGNVTKKAAQFLDGKTSVEYKVSSTFLGITDDGSPKEFELKWICPKDPKDIKIQKVPAPAENKRFTVSCEE
jgi:hypothetical protein